MRKLGFSLLFLTAATAASANSVTLTAAASVQGQAFFKSDARVFNRNATATISVHSTYYYCSAGICGLTSELDFTVPPRTAKAFDDIVATLFQLPNTQGAIEFATPGDDLVVTSRLYSENASGSFGQFVPGLEDEDAYSTSVLTSLQENADFRTNIVAYNPDDSLAIPVTVRLFDGNGVSLGSFSFTLGAETFFPSTRLTSLVGAGAVSLDNAYAVVSTDGTHGLFVAASVLDNHSQDTIFIKGERDTGAPGGQTVTITVSQWNYEPGGPVSGPLVLTAGGDYTLVFRSIDVRHGFSGISDLGIGATDQISPGHDHVVPHFRPQAFQRGTYMFQCTHVCGDFDSHTGMVGTLRIE